METVNGNEVLRCGLCKRKIPEDSKSALVDPREGTTYCGKKHYSRQIARDVMLELGDKGDIDQETVMYMVEMIMK